MRSEPIDPEVALNILRNVVREYSYPADRLRETVERERELGERVHPLGGATQLLRQVWGDERDAVRARFSLGDDVVAMIDGFAQTLTEMETEWRAGSPVDDFEGPEWSSVRTVARTILARTPNTRVARTRVGDVMPTIPPTEDGLWRLLDMIEGSVALEVEPGVDLREHYTDMSAAVAGLGTAFPDTFVAEVRRRGIYDDGLLTWGIHLMGDLPPAVAPLLLTGYLESSPNHRSAWLGLLVDYPQDEARDALVRALEDPSQSVQAAVALRRIGDPSVTDVLEASIAARPPEDPILLATMERALAALRRR